MNNPLISFTHSVATQTGFLKTAGACSGGCSRDTQGPDNRHLDA